MFHVTISQNSQIVQFCLFLTLLPFCRWETVGIVQHLWQISMKTVYALSDTSCSLGTCYFNHQGGLTYWLSDGNVRLSGGNLFFLQTEREFGPSLAAPTWYHVKSVSGSWSIFLFGPNEHSWKGPVLVPLELETWSKQPENIGFEFILNFALLMY